MSSCQKNERELLIMQKNYLKRLNDNYRNPKSEGGMILERFIIFGADGFLGFEVCNQLLESCYEVIHYNILNQPFQEEKELRIGRNSQFQSIESITQLPLRKTPQLFFQSMIGNFRMKYRLLLQEKLPHVFNRLLNEGYERMVLLLPQLPKGKKLNLNAFIHTIQQSKRKILSIYFPLLYGKWLSKETYLSQVLFHDQIERNLQILHISAAVKTCLQFIVSHQTGDLWLKNRDDKEWQKVYYSLTGIKSQITGQPTVQATGKEIIVKGAVDVALLNEIKKQMEENFSHL